MNRSLTERERLILRVIARARLTLAEERERLENDLGAFVEAAWPSIDGAEFKNAWCLHGLCEHLEAVADGQIRRLLVNFPPRASKTTITSICFPAWIFAQRERSHLKGPAVKFMCGSYGHELAMANSNMTRRLIQSPWYQKLWGRRFTLRADQNTKTKFDTSENGSRMAISVGSSLLGHGGDIILVDDPHNTAEIESEAERETALRWWAELSTTRLNDPKKSAIIVIMQRLHEDDVSGRILSESSDDWVHYCVPAEYEWRRHCTTVLGWNDPRGLDDDGKPLVVFDQDGVRLPRDTAAEVELEKREGTIFWPERFGPRELARIKAELGPYLSSGRLAQMPAPSRGGVFERSWWQLYESKDGKFPPFEYVIASVDSAFTAKEQNDPTGFTMWGVFFDGGKTLQVNGQLVNTNGHRRIMLIKAWRKHLPFSGPRIERGEREPWMHYKRRTQDSWGLLEWLYDSISNHAYPPSHPRHWMAHKLLIEAKASGISAAQELQNRFRFAQSAIQLVNPKGDKLARALAVQPCSANSESMRPTGIGPSWSSRK
jgi:hypothetical protein